MPARAVLIEKHWNGNRITARAARAQVRAALDIGENVAQRAKSIVHVISGDLQRSIHTAPEDWSGVADYEAATRGADLQDTMPATPYNIEADPTGVNLVVGSWLDYASIEEDDRGHAFIVPAVEMVKPTFDGSFVAAFKTEGL